MHVELSWDSIASLSAPVDPPCLLKKVKFIYAFAAFPCALCYLAVWAGKWRSGVDS
jgi:hypothetical protein